jgi:hypothetical protein
MKYLILLTALLAAPAVAQESNYPPFYAMQSCATMQEIAEISKKHNEPILFNGQILNIHASGQTIKTEFVFTVNQDTGSWTLVSLYPNGIACMVANGSNFEPYTENN